MRKYTALNKQFFSKNEYAIVPIRHDDRYLIMKWRNEQIYHLRQSKLLTKKNQDTYFDTTITPLFENTKPDQFLFSFLKNEHCIGYGGLVHINWLDKNAEISFIMDTKLEPDYFEFNWEIFLALIEFLAFDELKLHKIFTYAFDIRPQLYKVLEKCDYSREAELVDHCLIENRFKKVVIHSKFST